MPAGFPARSALLMGLALAAGCFGNFRPQDSGPDADDETRPDADLEVDADDRLDADGTADAETDSDADRDGDDADSGVPPDWWDETWGCRIRLEVDPSRVAGDLHGFPMLVSVRGVEELGDRAGENGAGLAFVASDGERLPHEVDALDPGSGDLLAWVLVPLLLASEPTVLDLYFCPPSEAEAVDPTAVWDDGYGGVWHLGDDLLATDQVLDSSRRGNHGETSSPFAPHPTAGRIGGGLDFDGLDDRVTVPSAEELSPPDRLTVSVWASVRVFGEQAGTMVAKAEEVGSTRNDYRLRAYDAWVDFAVYDDGNVAIGAAGWSPADPEVWHYLVGVVDGSALHLYFDGEPMAEPAPHAGGIRASDRPLQLGSWGVPDPLRTWSGRLDEVRVSTVPRSAEWILTEYRNQSSPDTFCAAGRVERIARDRH